MKVRFCISCGKELKGRSDKKFCDVQCKSLYHNTNRPFHEHSMQKINSGLRHNRSLLARFCPGEKSTVEKKVLEKQDFRFDLFTHIYPFSKGTYYFCYEYGYLPILEKGIPNILIVRKKEYMDKLSFDPWEYRIVTTK